MARREVFAAGEPHCPEPFRREDLDLGGPGPDTPVAMEDNPAVRRDDRHPFNIQRTRLDLRDGRVPWVGNVVPLGGEKLAEPEDTLVCIPPDRQGVRHGAGGSSSATGLSCPHFVADGLEDLVEGQLVEIGEGVDVLAGAEALGQHRGRDRPNHRLTGLA